MRKFLQPLRLMVQACFMAGLFLPFLPFADIVGQKIWITILFCGVFFCGWICHLGHCKIGWGGLPKKYIYHAANYHKSISNTHNFYATYSTDLAR